MNFLAHLHLAAHTGSSLTGNLLGDFIKGPLPTGLADHFDEGIWLHRKIDAFTDAHPAHRAAVASFALPWRRFGGIVVDMLYDHWLSQHWQRFSAAPLPRFLAQSYGQLLLDHHSLPQGLPMALRHMAEQDWLASYLTGKGWGRPSTASVVGCAAPCRSGRRSTPWIRLAGSRPSTPSCTSTRS